MPTSRGVRFAKELLRQKGSSSPVPVERIAKKYATVVRQALPDDVSGMLVPLAAVETEPQWAIVVNANDAAVRQRFTIAHELGHLLIHKYSAPHADGRYQVRFRDEKSATGSVREEIEANQFAAELLMPEGLVRAHAKRLRLDVADSALDGLAVEKLSRIAKKLEVSIQALTFRIANLGMA